EGRRLETRQRRMPRGVHFVRDELVWLALLDAAHVTGGAQRRPLAGRPQVGQPVLLLFLGRRQGPPFRAFAERRMGVDPLFPGPVADDTGAALLQLKGGVLAVGRCERDSVA